MRSFGQKNGYGERPTGHVIPMRSPLYGFGATLRAPGGFAGRVDAIYVDLWAAIDLFAVAPDWFEIQEHAPSTKDQVFYSLAGLEGKGACLVGENEATRVIP